MNKIKVNDDYRKRDRENLLKDYLKICNLVEINLSLAVYAENTELIEKSLNDIHDKLYETYGFSKDRDKTLYFYEGFIKNMKPLSGSIEKKMGALKATTRTITLTIDKLGDSQEVYMAGHLLLFYIEALMIELVPYWQEVYKDKRKH